jgi:hypothetical protein
VPFFRLHLTVSASLVTIPMQGNHFCLGDVMLDAVRPRRPRLGAGAGPLIGLSVSVDPVVWRIGPAWAVLAGALASGAPLLGDAVPLRLVGAAILADSAWGVLWRLTAADDADRANQVAEADHLPYFRPQSPAGRVLGMLRNIAPGASWRELTIALVLTGVLGLLLGALALALSAVAYVVIVWAWALGRAGKQPAICDALLNVGLPWLLGLILARDALQWSGIVSVPLPGIVMGLAFTTLQWGARRAYLSNGSRMFAIWFGETAVLLALIAVEQPWMWILMITAALFLPPAMWLWRSSVMAEGVERALRQSGPWWLAAMLLSAVALR